MCALNWINLEPYYLTITCIIIIPCFLGTIYNFGRIFYVQLSYQSHRYEEKLSEADVEYLMDPNHKMSVILVILFWMSWLPYIIHLVNENFTKSVNEPGSGFFLYWIGRFQIICRLPILTICFPRYREYFQPFCLSNRIQSTPIHFKRFNSFYTNQNNNASFQCAENSLYI